MAKLLVSVSKMLRLDAKDLFFGLMLYAGHGMIRDGSQSLVLNQYLKRDEYYVV